MGKDKHDDNPHSSRKDLKRKTYESDGKLLKKHKKKHKKRKISTSSSDTEKKKKVKKHKKKKNKKIEKTNKISDNKNQILEANIADVPLQLMSKSKAMAPMTKEEWDKRQSVIRRVYDEESGRHRLIKGDGEVIEEIVSYKRHKEINKVATAGDGAYFQSKTNSKTT